MTPRNTPKVRAASRWQSGWNALQTSACLRFSKTVRTDRRALLTSSLCLAPARLFEKALDRGSSGFEARQGGIAGVEEREERRAELQFLGKPGSLETKSTRLPPRSPPRRAGPGGAEARRPRLLGPQAANARPQRVLAESPEPRVWVTHCLRVAPALTKLRREHSTVPIAYVEVSSGDFSWSAS